MGIKNVISKVSDNLLKKICAILSLEFSPKNSVEECADEGAWSM
jgi:hypothetical protein